MSIVDGRTAADQKAPQALEWKLFAPTTAIFAAIAIIFAMLDLARFEAPYELQVVPFVLSVLLFGLPHGALDHLVPARLDSDITVRRSITTVVVLYVVLGGATALLWSVAPTAGFAAFITVTWFHWGQGDLWLDRALRRAVPSRLDAALSIAVRGALPMLLPLISHPQDYVGVLQTTIRVIAPRSVAATDLLTSVPLRTAAATLLIVLIGAHLLLRRHLGEPLRTTVLELGVLAGFFIAVPPILAVGLYFTFWHAVRHIIRLELLQPCGRRPLQDGDLIRPFAHFLRDALPVTLCAIALLLALALALQDVGLSTYLLLIAALTTPHTAIVTWMDQHRARPARAPLNFAHRTRRRTRSS